MKSGRDPIAFALLAAGFFQIATGLIMAFAPGAFFEHWAGLGGKNDHLALRQPGL